MAGILDYILGLGYSPHQAAAIAGNIKQESNFNPRALNKGEGAFGLMQWRLDRRQNLNDFARAQGRDPSDWRTQLDFMQWEMQNTESKNAKQFLDSTDLSSANSALRKYIRYGDNSQPTRLAYAQELGNGMPNFPMRPSLQQAPSFPQQPQTQQANFSDRFGGMQPPMQPLSPQTMNAYGNSMSPQTPPFGLGGGSPFMSRGLSPQTAQTYQNLGVGNQNEGAQFPDMPPPTSGPPPQPAQLTGTPWAPSGALSFDVNPKGQNDWPAGWMDPASMARTASGAPLPGITPDSNYWALFGPGMTGVPFFGGRG